MERSAEEIKDFVKERYGNLAKKRGTCCSPETVVAPNLETRAQRLYTREELEKLPKDVIDTSFGCGDPTALAELNEGEVVLDLGSGGGLDCFLAAQRVGEQGKVIGLDMTPEMVQLARENAQKMGVNNVEFRLSEMEHMPLGDNLVDVIISNCVINLAPDKDVVFREVYRVLRPGGRLCVSDIALVEELPVEIRESLEQWAGCLAGAIDEQVYLDKIRAAGLGGVSIERKIITFRVKRQTSSVSNPGGNQSASSIRGRVATVRVKAFKPSLSSS